MQKRIWGYVTFLNDRRLIVDFRKDHKTNYLIFKNY